MQSGVIESEILAQTGKTWSVRVFSIQETTLRLLNSRRAQTYLRLLRQRIENYFAWGAALSSSRVFVRLTLRFNALLSACW